MALAAFCACAALGEDFAKWVDPFVGTSGDGNCFPGACRPFGMVQPSPDTGDGSRVWCGGYKFEDAKIRGFSQTHLNGTGRPAMGDISILPVAESKLKVESEKFKAAFDKSSEIAEVGYYAVTLKSGVRCEATAAGRVAVWRFTWPESAERRLFVDAAAMLMQSFNQKKGATVPWSEAKEGEDRRSLSGGKTALGWTPYTLFYRIEFSEPWAKIEKLPPDPFQGKGDRWIVEFGDSLTPNCSDGSTNVSPFKNAGALAEASDKSELNQLEVRIALSTVSEEGASANMKAEARGKSFDEIRAECRAEWNALLSRAQLVKGTDEQKKSWYTALYHLFIQPNTQTDVDGRYRGADGEIHVAKRGHYSTFSLWDTFRAAHPLYTILCPERVPGFVDSLVAFGEQHGHLPMWTMWQGEDHCMVGIHSIPVIVDAWKKGLYNMELWNCENMELWKYGNGNVTNANCHNCSQITNTNLNSQLLTLNSQLSTRSTCSTRLNQSQLLTLMVQSMMNNDGENPKNCWNAYWENGYIPYFAGEFDEHLPKGQSVSTTLELAYDWWCIADFARSVGDAKTAKEVAKWADCWRNVFDEKTGFARPRAPKTAGGAWREPFDPANPRAGGNFWSDFTEANAWIYTWHVFQDPDRLADALGGRDKALAKLDEFFSTMPKGKGRSSDEGGLAADGNLRRGQIGMYWHGNEPSHHIAYLYSIWERRDKTAALVGRVCREAYKPQPDGLCGNDDCGQMSAWYIFSMMGFYPVNPCGDGYVLGEAQAEEVKLRVGSCEFRVVRCGNSGEVRLNGKPVEGAKISHVEIVAGGELRFGD